jgi:CRP/FNR family transcriptional regulator
MDNNKSQFLNDTTKFKDLPAIYQRSLLFSKLSRQQLDILKQNQFDIRFNPGENIRKQGTFLSHVIVIESGIAKLYLEGIDRRNLILRLIKPPQFIGGPGMYYDKRHHYTVTALTETTAHFIDAEVVKSFVQANSQFAAEFMSQISINMLSTFDRLIYLSQKQIPGRMADALLYLANEIFESNRISVAVSNRDLADLTGMSKDSAVRILREFKENGIILSDQEGLTILNMEELVKIGEVG